MKIGNLVGGEVYAWRSNFGVRRCVCLDPAPAWANRSLGLGAGNGLVSSIDALTRQWDDELVDQVLVVEPFDSARHGHKRGWPCFAVEYFTAPVDGWTTRWVPRAAYAGLIFGTWQQHLDDLAETARLAEEEERYDAEHAVEIAERVRQHRLEVARVRVEREREERRQRQRARIVADALTALGVPFHETRWPPFVDVPLDSVHQLLGLVAEDELALATLGNLGGAA